MTPSRNTINALAVATGILVLVNLLSFLYYTKRLNDDAKDSFRSQTVVDAAELLRTTLIDAETGQRGFLITGAEEYLEPYHSAMARLNDRIQYLMEFTRQDPMMNGLIQRLRVHIDKRVELLEANIQVRREKGMDAARERVSNNAGKHEMDLARGVLDEIVGLARSQVTARTKATAQSYQTTLFTSIVSSCLVIVSTSFFVTTVRKHIRAREQVVRDVQKSNELLSITLKSIGDGVITTDTEGRVVELNPVAEILTGWKTPEARGKPLTDIFIIINESTRLPVENPAIRSLQTGLIVGLANHTLLIRRDKQEFPIDDSAAPIRNAEGHVNGSVLVFRDVSERRHIERQLSERELAFRTIFDLAPIGIANTSLDGRILRVNQAFCDLLESKVEDLLSKTFAELTHPDDLTYNQELVGKLLRNEIPYFTIEKRYINHRGKLFWVSVTATLIRDEHGKAQSFVATIRDIGQLRQAEELRMRMAAIIHSSNDAIISKDTEGIVTSWNGAAERLFGYSADEMVGQSILKIIPPELHKEELDFLGELRCGNKIEQYRSVRIHKDGRRIEVLLNIAPLHYDNGRFMGISAIAKDLTAQLRAEFDLKESEARFRTLADNISHFAWMADSKGWIYWYNKRWYDYTGTTLDDMQGWGWQKVHHPDHVDRVVASVQHSWDTGEPWEDTFPLRGKDGSYRWFLSRALPIRNQQGDVVNWFGSNTDITELVEKEEKLRRAQEAAEHASRARGEFLANMSHEIRTPMTAILGHAEIMADHLQNPDDIQSIQTIRNNGKYLLQIINDILDLSKIDSGNLAVDLSPVSPSHLLAEVHQLLHVRAMEKGIEFQVSVSGSIPSLVQTDAVRLRQILVNLVGNAIKFTDIGQVSVYCSYDHGMQELAFDVKDTGIGIAPRDLEQLFQPFMQADTSSTRNFQGTGLGLAISKRLAIALGGDIAVQSEVGKGSQFRLLIPAAKSSVTNTSRVPQLENTIPPPRKFQIDGNILVVDDRRDIRILAQNFIEKAGGRVSFATNGQEAIATLLDDADSPIDLVLMDMQMPVMDGYSAAKELRERGFSKPIIALTANAMKDDRSKCLESGCDDYAMKPLDSAILVDMIARYIEHYRQIKR